MLDFGYTDIFGKTHTCLLISFTWSRSTKECVCMCSSPTFVHLSTLNYARISEKQHSLTAGVPPKTCFSCPVEASCTGDPTLNPLQPSLSLAIKDSFIICWLILCLPQNDSQVIAVQVHPPPLHLSTSVALRLWGHKAVFPPKQRILSGAWACITLPPPARRREGGIWRSRRRGGGSNLESPHQERSQHWDRRWYNIWIPRPGTHRRASPIKLSSPQWRGLENWHLHWECVSSFVGTDNFHLCRNRFAPKGSNNSRAILLMLVFGWKIGMRPVDLEGLLTGARGILV